MLIILNFKKIITLNRNAASEWIAGVRIFA